MRAGVARLRPGATEEDRSLAFAALVDEHLEASYRLAGVVLGSREEAEDATQDALERAWRGWRTLRDPSRTQAWFTSILLNTCRDRLRARRSVRLAFEPERTAADTSGEVARRDLLERAFEHLDADDRITLALRYYLDLPVAGMAIRLGIPEGTVKSRLHTAELRVRRILEAEEARR